ncbi:MAG: hypothetical protein WDO68_26670 [Gammaproteobacteria bacterium]
MRAAIMCPDPVSADPAEILRRDSLEMTTADRLAIRTAVPRPAHRIRKNTTLNRFEAIL